MTNDTQDGVIRTLMQHPLARIVIGVVLLLVFLFVGLNTWQQLDASHIMVIQSINGQMTWHTTPGIKWQGFGKVTLYKKRHQFYFSCPNEGDKGAADLSLPTTFNDGGKGRLCGSLAWELPLATEYLDQLNAKYGSDDAIQEQIIRTATEKSVTMTGPLVSSTESYSAKRNDLLFFILDQVSHGVYRTNVREEKVKDEMTGQDKTIKVVNRVASTDPNDRGWARQEPSPLDEFKLHAFNLTITDVVYDPTVINQIKQQQAAIMQVQTAIAQSKQAEQAAITAEKNGQAEAAQAKWKQEVEKATAVTKAEQERAVALLEVQTADAYKRKLVLEGEGEAAKRRLVMQADGALEKKLEAWIKVQQAYATAIEKHAGPWVPSVVMGETKGGTTGAADLIALLTARTAKEIGLDVSPRPQP